MTSANLQLIISNNLDIIPVNNNYEIVNDNTSLCKILIKDDNKIIPITKLNISSHGLIGVSHSVVNNNDNSVILSVVFQEGNKVLKNSGINIIAKCIYKKKTYTLNTEIKYIPFKKDEICKLAPSEDIIIANDNLLYSPVFLKIQIKREFDGVTKLFDSYKNYKITYLFSDDLSNEIIYYPNQYIDFYNILNIENNNRFPNYLLLNLYKDNNTNIPEQTIQLKIKRSKEFLKAQTATLVLDNEIDTIITDENYIITSDTYINSLVTAYIDNVQSKIILSDDYPIDIDVKVLDINFNDDINIEVIPELQEDGILNVHLFYPQGILIPKKMILDINTYVQYQNSSIIRNINNQFVINASPGFESIYQILANANAIRVNKENLKDPLIIGVNKYKWCGNKRELTTDGFVMFKKDAGNPEIYTEPLDTKDVLNNIIFEYYNSNMMLMDRLEIYVIFDGSELIEDEIVENNKFYFASNHDESDDYVPGPEENWIPNVYPDSTLYNIENPYLWMYESKIYKNPTTGDYYPVTTTPTIIEKFNAIIPIFYYYTGTETEGIGCVYNQETNEYIVTINGVEMKNDDSKKSIKWEAAPEIKSGNNLWQLIVYTYPDFNNSFITNNPIIINKF